MIIRPLRFGAALLVRETGRALVLLSALAAVAATAAARPPASDPLTPAALRGRFDMMVLAAAVVLLVLRIAVRIETDHREGWMLPLVAARASRIRYGVGVVVAACAASAVIYCVGAVSFAAAVRGLAGSSELTGTLHRTLAGGLLLLGVYGAFSGIIAMLLRSSIAAVIVIGAAVIVPYALLTRHLLSGEAVAWWAYALTYVVPPIVPPAHVRAAIPMLAQVALACLLLAAVSRRFAARIP